MLRQPFSNRNFSRLLIFNACWTFSLNLATPFFTVYMIKTMNLALLIGINIVSGIATAGINLSLTNIGLKLAPKEDAIAYLSAQNITSALFSSLAPLLGGLLADFFTSRHLRITAQWTSPNFNKVFRLLMLHEWNFLFLIGAGMAMLSLQWLAAIKEPGEVEKDKVVRMMRTNIRSNLKEYFLIGNIITWNEQVRAILRKKIFR